MAKAHAKFSASGAKRWIECPGSVQLSENLPSIETSWAREGTLAHEVLEAVLLKKQLPIDASPEMVEYAQFAARFIADLNPGAPILVEEKVSLEHIHPDTFGTLDVAIVEHFGTLSIVDYKYGVAPISPVENLQLIYYALGVAYQYGYNFVDVNLWIIQPRVTFDPAMWPLPIAKLVSYEEIFKIAIARSYMYPEEYKEGQWCHFCKAKNLCPLKINERKNKKENHIQNIISKIPVD